MNSFIQFLLVISFICYDGIDPSPQKKLTKKQKGIIESLVSFADSLNGKTKSSSIILTKIATLKNDNVEFMPFYHLDIDKFYKDPLPKTFSYPCINRTLLPCFYYEKKPTHHTC